MSRRSLLLAPWLVLALALVQCGGGSAGGGNAGSSAGGDPGAAQPSAPEPAPAPGAPAPLKLQVEELATGLESPWSLAFLPDRRMLISQRGGSLRLHAADGGFIGMVGGVPPVMGQGQGGLLDVALDPGFAANRRLYLSFSEGSPGLNGTAVARAELDLSARRLVNLVVIFQQQPKVDGTAHFGSRLVFDRGGALFVTLGERQSDAQRGYAQDLARGHGKVMRITVDGQPAPGNPFPAGVAGVQPAIWSYGHRNVQGAAVHPATGELWVSEHGPQGGDEVNRSLRGLNYGWPVVSFGQEYGTTRQVGEGTAKDGMEPPAAYWETIDGAPWHAGTPKSSIAPSGMAFYTADAVAPWKGNLFVGALAGTALWRLVLDGNAVVARERLLAERGERIRDVRQGPDGALYLLTDGAQAKLLRVTAAPG